MNSDHLKKTPIYEVSRLSQGLTGQIDSVNKELTQIKQDITYIKNYITMKKNEDEQKKLSEDQLKQQGWFFS